MKGKIIDWIKRYLPAEIFAIIGALVGGSIIHLQFNNPILTALGGTWGENIGFYGYIISTDIRKRKKKDKEITPLGALKILRDLILEFGAGEYLDSFVIRPFAMYYFPTLLNNVPLGLLLGKLTADVTFYIPTIFSYEMRKKYVRD